LLQSVDPLDRWHTLQTACLSLKELSQLMPCTGGLGGDWRGAAPLAATCFAGRTQVTGKVCKVAHTTAPCPMYCALPREAHTVATAL